MNTGGHLLFAAMIGGCKSKGQFCEYEQLEILDVLVGRHQLQSVIGS